MPTRNLVLTKHQVDLILEYIEDLEDLATAERRLKKLRKGRGELVPYSKVRRLLGLRN